MFIVGNKYTRTEIRNIAGDPGVRGKWEKGYFEHENDMYLFANIGGKSFLGVDHENSWINENTLSWNAMKISRPGTEVMQKLLDSKNKVHIFTRNASNGKAKGMPFTYHGLGRAREYFGENPVHVIWDIYTDQQEKLLVVPNNIIEENEQNDNKFMFEIMQETKSDYNADSIANRREIRELFSYENAVYEQNSILIKREAKIARNALERANFECEYNEEHKTFISANTNKQYMEAHHLIPISLQHHFLFRLDKEANIICLCPTCHRKIHYGKKEEKNSMITFFFEKRIDRLKIVGINIDIETLLMMYM